jgi:hypothetical protein
MWQFATRKKTHQINMLSLSEGFRLQSAAIAYEPEKPATQENPMNLEVILPSVFESWMACSLRLWRKQQLTGRR